jgi:Family of unknown function (DUF6526)
VADTPQSNAHPTGWDPPFHFFVVPMFVFATVAAIVRLFRHFHHHPLHGVLMVLLALAALVAVFKTRLNALKVQDRVIRLEERLRLATVLPEPLRSRIPELTVSQLVALRFASDGELPGLVQKTLNENLSRDDIKKSIQNWRADNCRV